MGLILCFLLISGVYSATFQISSVSTCTVTTSGFCTKWQQNGTVVEQFGACFPGTAKVMTRQGLKPMSSIQIGDQILGQSNQNCLLEQQQCQPQFVQVIAWLHHQAEKITRYKKVYTNDHDSHFLVTDFHLVAVEKQQHQYQYIYAKDLNKKILLGHSQKVQRIEDQETVGLYSPLTQTSNYFVYLENSNQEQRILAHSFGNIKNPELYESIIINSVRAYQYIWGIPNQKQYAIHPVCDLFASRFSFMLDGMN